MASFAAVQALHSPWGGRVLRRCMGRVDAARDGEGVKNVHHFWMVFWKRCRKTASFPVSIFWGSRFFLGGLDSFIDHRDILPQIIWKWELEGLPKFCSSCFCVFFFVFQRLGMWKLKGDYDGCLFLRG